MELESLKRATSSLQGYYGTFGPAQTFKFDQRCDPTEEDHASQLMFGLEVKSSLTHSVTVNFSECKIALATKLVCRTVSLTYAPSCRETVSFLAEAYH